MRILLSGATGFVGKPLVQYLVKDGHQCVVLSRNSEVANEWLPEGAEACSYEDVWPPVEAVINLAGEHVAGLWTGRKRAAILNSRVGVTRQLVEWMAQQQPRPHTFLSGSAVGYYGHRPGEVLTEKSPPDPACQFRCQVCRAWEGEARQAEAPGVRVVTLRMGNILHPSGGYWGKLFPWFRRTFPVVFGDPQAMLSWASLEDTVSMITFALEQKAVSGPLNVTSPYPVSQAEFSHLLAGYLGKRVWGRIPSFLMRLALGDFAAALLDSQDVRPAKATGHGFQFRHSRLSDYLATLSSLKEVTYDTN